MGITIQVKVKGTMSTEEVEALGRWMNMDGESPSDIRAALAEHLEQEGSGLTHHVVDMAGNC